MTAEEPHPTVVTEQMPDLAPLGISVLTFVAIAFMLWFALGTQKNVSKGNELLRWLQAGLPVMGRRTTLRWFGSSAVELKITDPRRPFRDAEAVIVLEPRDLSWLWALGRARGRRDFLILRARLERSPAFELEVGDLRGWTGRDRLDRIDAGAWDHADWGHSSVRVVHTRDAKPELVRRLWSELGDASGGVWRISVRRAPPHLEVHVVLPDIGRARSEPLFDAFRELAQAVMS